ncbi:msx2-interacting protein-like isoform X2 [Phyllobates terribilis]|uniref:msx2-interacting protein-like isoform X2 n=1 Tax=Phyllobates terribilis TaxID=111132 RepID=UPI003CCAC192
MVRETRHLWVGNLPENVRDDKIIEHFKRYGHVENVRILPKRGSDGGVAAFVDFATIESAQKAHNAVNKMGDRELRTDYNKPGVARVLDETVSITSPSREVSGFRAGGGRTTYGPPQSLHAWEGRYERTLDGASDTRERSYEHSAYGHHERGTAGGFERTRHYDQDYYRDARDRTLQHGIYNNSQRSPSPFDASHPHIEARIQKPLTLPSVAHRDIYRTDTSREVRGRRRERKYQHSRSRSPHSSQSSNQSPQRLASQASRPARSRSGSRSRSSSSASLSSSTVSFEDDFDVSREVRGRQPERIYQHSRSRSPHSSQSRTQSPQRLASQASRPSRSPSGSGSWSRSSSSASLSSSTVSFEDDFDDASQEVRGRRPERTYQHSRSRSPHSSQSRNQSPQRLASQASRPARSPSGSGSRSRSSSSDSRSSSTSSDSDSRSTSSGESAAVPAPPSQTISSMDKDEPRKSFGIKVENLPVRSTDSSLKDGFYHEFKKYGTVTSVQIHGVSEERYGLVFFRQQEDQEKALNASKGKLFFGMQIEVTAWVGPETESENEFRPLDERIDEFHPKATRTLFITNLEKTTTHLDLRDEFKRFGEIVHIDVKMVNGVPQYAFLEYCDITNVCKAIKKMDGEYLGNNRLKLGFGKSIPTKCVWIAALSSSVTARYLTRHFSRYGPVLKVVYDRFKGMALILYNEIEFAQAAVKETKGRKIGGNVVKVDFASEEMQVAFNRSMASSGQVIRDIYEIPQRRSDETRRGSFHEFTTTERTYFDSARTPGTYQEETRREYPARSGESYQGDCEQRCYNESREDTDLRDPSERVRSLQSITPRDQPFLGEATVGQINTIYYSLLSAISGRK